MKYHVFKNVARMVQKWMTFFRWKYLYPFGSNGCGLC